jgi:hypothetical protein
MPIPSRRHMKGVVGLEPTTDYRFSYSHSVVLPDLYTRLTIIALPTELYSHKWWNVLPIKLPDHQPYGNVWGRIELPYSWCARRDSNSQNLDFKSSTYANSVTST